MKRSSRNFLDGYNPVSDYIYDLPNLPWQYESLEQYHPLRNIGKPMSADTVEFTVKNVIHQMAEKQTSGETITEERQKKIP